MDHPANAEPALTRPARPSGHTSTHPSPLHPAHQPAPEPPGPLSHASTPPSPLHPTPEPSGPHQGLQPGQSAPPSSAPWPSPSGNAAPTGPAPQTGHAPLPHRRGRAHPPELWARIRQAYLGGVSAGQLSEAYGVPEGTIRDKARRNGWTRAQAARAAGAVLDGQARAALDAARPAAPPDLEQMKWSALGQAAAALSMQDVALAERLVRLALSLERLSAAGAASAPPAPEDTVSPAGAPEDYTDEELAALPYHENVAPAFLRAQTLARLAMIGRGLEAGGDPDQAP